MRKLSKTWPMDPAKFLELNDQLLRAFRLNGTRAQFGANLHYQFRYSKAVSQFTISPVQIDDETLSSEIETVNCDFRLVG